MPSGLSGEVGQSEELRSFGFGFYRSPVAVSVQLIPEMEADLDSVITDLLVIHGHRELFLNAHDSGLRK